MNPLGSLARRSYSSGSMAAASGTGRGSAALDAPDRGSHGAFPPCHGQAVLAAARLSCGYGSKLLVCGITLRGSRDGGQMVSFPGRASGRHRSRPGRLPVFQLAWECARHTGKRYREPQDSSPVPQHGTA